MERLKEIPKTDLHHPTEKQMTLWPPSFETETSNNLLVSKEWIREHSLRPEVAKHASHAEINKMLSEGAKPPDIIIIHLGQ